MVPTLEFPYPARPLTQSITHTPLREWYTPWDERSEIPLDR